jgi:hypothetical protein
MAATRHWTVDLYIGEDDGLTYAEAVLNDDIGNHVLGIGRASVNPADPDVPDIGDAIAAARALNDLGQRLLNNAAGDLQSTVDEEVDLRR